MKRIFTILAFTVLAISSFGQYDYDVEYIYDETTGDSVEIHVAPFKIEGGMVYSWGTIKVYDITGRLVAMSSQEFNVNALKHTMVYIIVAEEGVIKYNGAWVTYGFETREQMKGAMKGMPEQIYKWNDFSNTWVIVTDDDK